MLTNKKLVTACAGMVLCSMVLLGCSESQEKKQEQKAETRQEQIGREAAGNLQKPLEEARRAADQVEAKAGQTTLQEVGEDTRQTGRLQTTPDPRQAAGKKRNWKGAER
jgi:hypothetical protein